MQRSNTAMDGCGKSDRRIVLKKSANKGNGKPITAEQAEERRLAKGNRQEQNRLRTQNRARLQSKLVLIRKIAEKDKEAKFTTLWHHVYDIDRLRETFYCLKRNSVKGVDGETWQHYLEDLDTCKPPVGLASGYYVDYDYNNLGQKKSIKITNGSLYPYDVRYGYFANGWLKEVKRGASESIASYSYDVVGNSTRVINGNNTYTDYAFDTDPRYRTSSINHYRMSEQEPAPETDTVLGNKGTRPFSTP